MLFETFSLPHQQSSNFTSGSSYQTLGTGKGNYVDWSCTFQTGFTNLHLGLPGHIPILNFQLLIFLCSNLTDELQFFKFQSNYKMKSTGRTGQMVAQPIIASLQLVSSSDPQRWDYCQHVFANRPACYDIKSNLQVCS